MSRIKCPVCQKKYIKQGFRNHIINSAKGEAFIQLNNLLDAAKNKPYEFSPAVLLKNTKHLQYYRKNLKIKTKKFLEFSFQQSKLKTLLQRFFTLL